MKRRELIHKSAAFGALAAIPAFLLEERLNSSIKTQQEDSRGPDAAPPAVLKPLTPPRNGQIPVAFVISDGTVMIDFAGLGKCFRM